MRRVLLPLGVALFSACLTLASDPPAALSGCWTVARALPTTNVAALSQADVDQAIGTHIVFDKACMKSGSSTLLSPRFVATELSEREFAESVYRIPLTQLGIYTKATTMVEIRSATPNGESYLGEKVFLGGPQPVIEYQGVFFALKKANAGDAKCTCPVASRP
jgi:hypothetical protein